MAGTNTEYLTSDFLYEYRKFVKKYEFDQRYAFAFVNADDSKMFRWLNKFDLGRFDTPGIIAFKDLKEGIFYRNYETYDGFNFNSISEDLLTSIKRN